MRKPLFIAKQGRKPSGLLGQIVARVTAKETAGANEIALQLLQLQPDDAVLEIGSGHGETLAIYHVRPEAEVAKLASDAGFEAVDLSRHTRGALQFSYVGLTGRSSIPETSMMEPRSRRTGSSAFAGDDSICDAARSSQRRERCQNAVYPPSIRKHSAV